MAGDPEGQGLEQDGMELFREPGQDPPSGTWGGEDRRVAGSVHEGKCEEVCGPRHEGFWARGERRLGAGELLQAGHRRHHRVQGGTLEARAERGQLPPGSPLPLVTESRHPAQLLRGVGLFREGGGS